MCAAQSKCLRICLVQHNHLSYRRLPTINPDGSIGMDEITRLGTADFEEGIDFLNRVFSKPDSPMDFLRSLPKIYRAEEHLMSCNLAIRRDGRIRAVVGVFPMEVSIGGRILKAAGIGGVSTHPEERGHGLMRRLMEAALADMAAKGVALSVLGGQRQRYHY